MKLPKPSPAVDPDAPNVVLVGMLTKGLTLVELVRNARWRRKRGGAVSDASERHDDADTIT